MKAVRFHAIGSPEVLRVDDVDKPSPGSGQALVKVHVVGVNFADTLSRRGTYISQPNLPETIWSRYSTGLKRRGLQPRRVSSDCLLQRLDKAYNPASPRSEERRVGKECRSRW